MWKSKATQSDSEWGIDNIFTLEKKFLYIYVNLIKVLTVFFSLKFSSIFEILIAQMVSALYLRKITHSSYRPSFKVTNPFMLVNPMWTCMTWIDTIDTTHAENARHMPVLHWCKATGCRGKAYDEDAKKIPAKPYCSRQPYPGHDNAVQRWHWQLTSPLWHPSIIEWRSKCGLILSKKG